MYWHANQHKGRILNGLEFPDPTGCREPDFQLSTDTVAWGQTRDQPLCKADRHKPLNDIRWGLAATAHAISYWHVDANGYGTYVDVQEGAKWWVVGKQKEDGLGPSFASKMLYQEFDPQEANDDLWEVHATHLVPGDRL